MSEGKQFELDWKNSCKADGIYIERFKDNAMWSGQARVKASKNPCDFIMYSKPYLFLLEMKSTKGTSFSFNEKIIKQHQIDSLLKAQEHDGVIAGFLFNFRDRVTQKIQRENTVFFVGISEFVSYKNSCGRSSINEDSCRDIGVKIGQKKKISHFHYEVEQFIDFLNRESSQAKAA